MQVESGACNAGVGWIRFGLKQGTGCHEAKVPSPNHLTEKGRYKMFVEDLTEKELREIKRELDKTVAFELRLTKIKKYALMDRLTKEVGYKKKD